MKRSPLAIWRSEVSETSEIGLKLVVQKATREAFSMCKEAYPGYHPLNYIVGWNRFVKLQHKLLAFGKTDGSFKSKTLFHVNGMPFTEIFTPSIRLHTAPADSENDYPTISLFRQQEIEDQLRFLNGAKILIGHLSVGVGLDMSELSVATVHFLDGQGAYFDERIDIKSKRIAPPVIPIEGVDDHRDTPRSDELEDDESDEGT